MKDWKRSNSQAHAGKARESQKFWWTRCGQLSLRPLVQPYLTLLPSCHTLYHPVRSHTHCGGEVAVIHCVFRRLHLFLYLWNIFKGSKDVLGWINIPSWYFIYRELISLLLKSKDVQVSTLDLMLQAWTSECERWAQILALWLAD